MLGLAVDTSTPAGSLAIFEDARLRGVIGTWEPETYSSRLFRQLDFLLGELDLAIDRFDLFAVTTGPGSFTGLRVGLTAVKAWAATLEKPVAPVSVLEAIAAQSRSCRPTVVPFLDARRGQVFAGIYRRADGVPEPAGPEVVFTPAELLEWLAPQVVADQTVLVSPTPEVLLEALPDSRLASCPVEAVSPFLAAELSRLAMIRVQQGRLTDALRLDANYVRQSDAELKWTE